MRDMTATDASRGFSDLLDTVERGETVTITRGGKVVAEIRPAGRRTGRDLRRMLESRSSLLADDDAFEHDISNGMAMLTLPDADPWPDA